jgi:hypothetical protein
MVLFVVFYPAWFLLLVKAMQAFFIPEFPSPVFQKSTCASTI